MVRVLVALSCALLLSACGATQHRAEPAPVATYPTSFEVSDPENDAETTAAGFEHPPNLDLIDISAHVGPGGLRATFRYARDWGLDSRARWGIRFELVGSDRSRLSGAWTHEPGSGRQIFPADLAPQPPGCTGRVSLEQFPERLMLALSRDCLPAPTRGEPRGWVRFDTLESVTSWHAEHQIRYGWDQLYARVVAPEPAKLYLPH